MLIEMQTSRSTRPGPRKLNATAQTLLIPAVVAALLMAAALAGCSAAPQRIDRQSAPALLIHNQAAGQDNGNLTGNFIAPRRLDRQHRTVYVAAGHGTAITH